MELELTAGHLREGWSDGEGSRHRGQGGRWARNACVRETKDNETRSDRVATKTNTFTLSHPHTIHFHSYTLTPSTSTLSHPHTIPSTVTPSHHPPPHCHTLYHPPPHCQTLPPSTPHCHTLTPSTSTLSNPPSTSTLIPSHHLPPHIIPPTPSHHPPHSLTNSRAGLQYFAPPQVEGPSSVFLPHFLFL